MDEDVWIYGGLVLTAGALGFLNYKNVVDRKTQVTKLAVAAQDTAHDTGIPISYIVAQAAHESNYGKSKLATQSNNLFGIKAQTGYAGRFDTYPTTEFVNGKNITVQARFRKYNSWEESVKDWADFLSTPRYTKAVAAAKAHNSALFFSELQKAGYATDPNYSNSLVGTLNSIAGMV